MANLILKIPGNSKAYLFAKRDDAQDKFDVKKFLFNYGVATEAAAPPPIYLTLTGLWLSNSILADWDVGISQTRLDPDWYDGNTTYYFEVYGNKYAGTSHTVTLVDEEDNEYAEIEFTADSGGNVKRRVEFTPATGEHIYSMILGTPVGATGGLHVARSFIVVEQDDTMTKNSTEYQLAQPYIGGYTNNKGAGCVAAANRFSYSQQDEGEYVNYDEMYYGMWEYDASITGLDSVLFEVVGMGFLPYGEEDPVCLYAALFDRTTNTMVPDTELVFDNYPSGAPDWLFPWENKSVSIPVSSLTQGHIYELRCKTMDDWWNVVVGKAALRLMQSSTNSSGTIYRRQIGNVMDLDDVSFPDWDAVYCEVPNGFNAYFEVIGSAVVSESDTVSLADMGVIDPITGDTHTDVEGSELLFDVGRTLSVAGPLALTDGNVYTYQRTFSYFEDEYDENLRYWYNSLYTMCFLVLKSD